MLRKSKVVSIARRRSFPSIGPVVARSARSGRSRTRELGRVRGIGERVELLGYIRNDRIQTQGRRGDPGEAEEVLGHDGVRLADQWISDSHVDAEWSPVDLAGESALGTVPISLVAHPVVQHLGMLVVGPDLEGHVVAEVEPTGLLKASQYRTRQAHHPQIDILVVRARVRRELEHEPTLECHRVAGYLANAGEEWFEDEELSTSRRSPTRSTTRP